MRIAFVGKGGSGKTTISALFTSYLVKLGKPVLAIDGDINMHMGELLGLDITMPAEKQLSNPDSMKYIKTYLKGRNNRINDLSQFRKSTPPTRESNFLVLSDKDNPILKNFSFKNGDLSFMVVGTYDPEGIGASCYHGNLTVLENILSHTIDDKGYLVVDMVAGTDAFANTMHAQFDLLVLVIEPTIKGIEVFKQYNELAQSANIKENIVVIGNKIRNDNDKEFLRKNIPKELLIGFFNESEYLRKHEQTGGKLDINSLEKENIDIINQLLSKLAGTKPDNDKRLKRLYEIHKRLSSQGSNKEQFNDFVNQIDESFSYEKVLQGSKIK